MSEQNFSFVRIKEHTAKTVGNSERHNERKNENYSNDDVDLERSNMNIHFKNPNGKSYMEILREMEAEGKVSERGLRDDATLFDEMIFDVNTRYFDNHGGYEYAKEFFSHCYNFAREKYGDEYIVSAVMHADELNKGLTADKGDKIYHYHLHVVAIPVVEKEIRWSKRCKDEALRGTVKEIIHQISHSKKWPSLIPETDENGDVIIRQNGKPSYVRSYSILQDEIFQYLRDKGYTDIERGIKGSTAENLTSLEYQIKKDSQHLSDIQNNLKKSEIKYESAQNLHKTFNEIESMGKKSIGGKYTVPKENYETLTTLAKEGIASRGEIGRLQDKVNDYSYRLSQEKAANSRLHNKLNELKEICEPFLYALEHFPNLIKAFIDKLKELYERENQLRAEKKTNRNRDDGARLNTSHQTEHLGRTN